MRIGTGDKESVVLFIGLVQRMKRTEKGVRRRREGSQGGQMERWTEKDGARGSSSRSNEGKD